jgi:hypothetical protein
MQMNAADSPQNVSSVIAELEGIGGGVFLTRRGVESRIAVPELWRAFEQPGLVWVHGEQFDDSGVEGLVAIAKSFHICGDFGSRARELRRMEFVGCVSFGQTFQLMVSFASQAALPSGGNSGFVRGEYVGPADSPVNR